MNKNNHHNPKSLGQSLNPHVSCINTDDGLNSPEIGKHSPARLRRQDPTAHYTEVHLQEGPQAQGERRLQTKGNRRAGETGLTEDKETPSPRGTDRHSVMLKITTDHEDTTLTDMHISNTTAAPRRAKPAGDARR